MIPLTEFDALFATTDAAGRKTWHGCKVVGLTTDRDEPRIVVLVDGPTCYALTVSEVRHPVPHA
jgi:hypothetical protein